MQSSQKQNDYKFIAFVSLQKCTIHSLIPVVTDSVKQFFGLFHLLYFSVTNKKI